MPIYFDNSGQGFDGGCFDPDDFGGMSPDTPAQETQQNPDLFADSYFWSRFTDITNGNPMRMTGMQTDDEIAAEWAFNGGNPNDLPLENWSFQARSDYESQAAYDRWKADTQQAAFEQQQTDIINQEASEISDLQARAAFVMKMQQYLNSHLIDSDAYAEAMRIYDSTALSNSSTTNTVNNPGSHAEVTGVENGTPTVSGQVYIHSPSANSNLNTFANNYDLNGQNVNYLTDPSTNSAGSISNISPSANDNFTIYVDLSKKAETEKVVGHPMSYFEYVLFLAFKEAFAKRGQHPSDSEISLIAANAAQSGGYYVQRDGNSLTNEALLLDLVSRGYFVISQMQVNFGQIDNVLRAAGYNPQTLQRTVGAVTVNSGSSNANLTTTLGTLGTTVSPLPLITIGGISGSSAVLESSLAGSSAELRAVVTVAQELFKDGAISAELMTIVAGLPAAIVSGTLAIDYYFLFDYIINRAKEIAGDRAHQEALANEIAALAVEVARQKSLSDAASIELAQITVLMNSRPTDYANPTGKKNPLDNTFEDPFAESQPLTTTGGSGLQTTPPEGEPPIDISKILAKIAAFLGGLDLGLLASKLTQAEKDELKKAGYVLPTLPPDPNRVPGGTPTNPNNDGEIAENEAALALSKFGYVLVQNRTPTVDDLVTNPWMRPDAKPDYYFPDQGVFADCYTPGATTSARNIATTLAGKATNQARNLVLNMKNSNIPLEGVKEAIKLEVPNQIKQVIVITNDGRIVLLIP